VANPSLQRMGFFACLSEIFGFDKNTLDPHCEIPIDIVTMPVSDPVSVRRKRLLDQQLEQSLASGEIVPLEIHSLTRTTQMLTPQAAAIAKSSARNRAAGIVVHRLLELWDGASDLDVLLRNVAHEYCADDCTMTGVVQRLGTLRRSTAFDRIIRGETIARELPIRFIDENDLLVERRIDRLIREDGREVVVDYKTGTKN